MKRSKFLSLSFSSLIGSSLTPILYKETDKVSNTQEAIQDVWTAQKHDYSRRPVLSVKLFGSVNGQPVNNSQLFFEFTRGIDNFNNLEEVDFLSLHRRGILVYFDYSMSFGQEHHFLKIGRSATNGISVRSNGSIYRLHGSTSGGILLSYSQDFPRKQDYRFSASEGNWRLNGGCRRNPSGTGKACYTLHSGGGSVDGHFIDIE